MPTIDLGFLQQLDKLSLIIRKNITSNFSGERKSKVSGSGILFKDYSMYGPGQDIRHIDWKVYARSDKLFVKRFEEERNLTVHAIVDYSGSMGFGSQKMLKSTYAAMVGVGFAYIAMKNNERFVLSTFSDKLVSYPPKRGRAHLAYMFDLLNKRQPSGVTSFEKTLSQYKKFIDTRSYIIIVSDFLYSLQEIHNVLSRFRKNQVILIQVLDPVESELDLEGDFRLQDLETKDVLKTYISPSYRKKYVAQLKEHNDSIRKFCLETNAKFYSFSTSKPIFDVFYEVLQD